MAPWLELGPDNTQEGQIREKYIRLMIESINHGFNPQSPDYLNFTVTRQPLVDTAFFCQGLLRSPKQIWSKLSAETQKNILNALQQVSKIKPVESNWLLFSAMVEATLLELTGKCNMHPIEYAIMRFKEWYKGDSWYGDGINLHMVIITVLSFIQCSWIFWKSCRNITKAKPTFIKKNSYVSPDMPNNKKE